jgi:hypothetical protein
MAATILNQHSRSSFVDPKVIEIQTTKNILDNIYAYYPKDCICISGYLNDSAQYWKVNYHWEYLLYQIDKFISSKGTEAEKGFSRSVRQVMLSNPPNPSKGYRTDKHPGDTVDSSSPEIIIQRHKMLLQCKKDFKSILLKARVINLATELVGTPSDHKPWWLSVAKIAAPGKSKHGTGYALDIMGNNKEITRISYELGATLVFNESSHVHVEFKNF